VQTSENFHRVNWFQFAAPRRFYPLAGKLVPWFGAAGFLLAAYGLYLGLWVAPTDATQGQAYRIIFVHVPTAWMSMVIYVAMAGWAGAGLVFNSRLSSMMACALAPTGALMTVLALLTGALWGKPTWGAWWVWDARLTSELVLLFLYIGFMSLHASIDDVRRIYFSVKWWNTLHQGASVSLKGASMATPMLLAMLVMTLAFWAYCIAVVLKRVRVIILERERHTVWARTEMGVQ
jgi:heme exporter protein C